MPKSLLRPRNGISANVSFSELFFDLIYVFAVTQLSHYLLHHLTLIGALQTLTLWFAAWLAWQYTAWVTNWFDPDTRKIRLLLFFLMLSSLIFAAGIPDAFEGRGLVFALAYTTIQVGRTVFVLLLLDRDEPLKKNFQRILGWLVISAIFWLAGGLTYDNTRLVLWTIAVLCEYVSPMLGFRLPLLGKSVSQEEWKIEGHHLAERCQLFVIVALGESILTTGATLSELDVWGPPTIIAALISFTGSLAMWWIYFDTSSKAGSHAITNTDNPGLMGSYFHYIHVILIGAIIICAVANELVISHPDQRIKAITATVLLSGPVVYILGNAIYKRLVYGRYPLSHLVGIFGFILLIPIMFLTDLLMVNTLETIILIAIATWDSYSRIKN